MGPAGFGRLWG